MTSYLDIADEFFVNMNLSTELGLPSGRDTLLHFFEQLKKRYPTMRNFYSRDKGDYVLEEDKDSGSYRWASVENKRISSGYVNPDNLADPMEQHQAVLDSIPYSLSVSPLDCESINYILGFDFGYRGNHHELLAEALGMPAAFEKLVEGTEGKIVLNEPAIQLAFGEDCRTQCRLSIESRTTAYHIRTGEFPEEQISVYLTMRRYGSLTGDETFVSVLADLKQRAEKLMDDYVVENVLHPLQQAIAIK